LKNSENILFWFRQYNWFV